LTRGQLFETTSTLGRGSEMRLQVSRILFGLIIVGFLLPPDAQAVTLTFEATYNREVVFVGAAATESRIAPINFSFSISFDPTVIGASGPNFSTSGNNTNVNATTLFGASPFSSSPFTSSLIQLAGINPNSPNQSNGYATQYYDSYSGGSIPNTGFRAASFVSSMHSNGASNYFFSAGAYVGGVPLRLDDVRLTDGETFVNWLTTAKTESLSWFVNEGGTFYPADINQRKGDEYRGYATLVSISGVPEPSTWAMMFLGFAGVGYLAYRRRKVAALAA
jgi:hypothetical protein